MSEWVPAGERYRVAYGYRTRLLNAHHWIAYTVGLLRSIAHWVTWQVWPEVSPAFVEILDRSTGVTLRRWTLGAEHSAPVSSMEWIVKDIAADLLLLDVGEFEAKYA